MNPLIQRAQEISSRLPIIKIFSNNSISHNIGDIKDKKRGIGEEFWDYRDYQLGDPLKSIDWKKSSKVNRILIKNKENESSRNIWFWCNEGVSMNFRYSGKFEKKSERSKILSLILIDIFLRSGEKVGIVGSELGLQNGQKRFISIASEFVNKSYKLYDSRIKKNDIVFVFSDFLEKPHIIKKNLLNLTESIFQGFLVQILDPSELTFPFKGRNQFFDPFSGLHKIFNKSENMKDTYKSKFKNHRNELKKICLRFGWKFFSNSTDSNYQSLLLQIYRSI